MIYNKDEYTVKFYQNSENYKSDVYKYIERLSNKVQSKIYKYIEHLRINNGYLDEPYSKHIKGKIRELRIDFGKSRNRIFYYLAKREKCKNECFYISEQATIKYPVACHGEWQA